MFIKVRLCSIRSTPLSICLLVKEIEWTNKVMVYKDSQEGGRLESYD